MKGIIAEGLDGFSRQKPSRNYRLTTYLVLSEYIT